MQDPKPSTLDASGRKARTHPKRKLSQQATCAAESQFSTRTITDHFRGSNRKPLQKQDSSSHDISPSAKRAKAHHLSVPASPTPTQVIPPERMYNFTNSDSRPRNDVIDLTSSPNASPSKTPLIPRRNNRIVRPTNFTPHTGAKRLVVKNLRKTPRSSQDQYFNQVWDHLDSALTAVFDHEKVPHSLEELYRGVENLCKQERAPEIYTKLCERCKSYVSGKLKEPLLAKARISEDVDVLRAVVGAWSTWNAQLVWHAHQLLKDPKANHIIDNHPLDLLLYGPVIPSTLCGQPVNRRNGARLVPDPYFCRPQLKA